MLRGTRIDEERGYIFFLPFTTGLRCGHTDGYTYRHKQYRHVNTIKKRRRVDKRMT